MSARQRSPGTAAHGASSACANCCICAALIAILSLDPRAVLIAVRFADLSAIIWTVSGESHLNPDISALKYSRTMESDGVQAFKEAFGKTHKDVTITDSFWT